MIEPNEKTKYILRNWNATSENETEYFDTLADVTNYINIAKLSPDDFSVYEIAKEIKFKVVPA